MLHNAHGEKPGYAVIKVLNAYGEIKGATFIIVNQFYCSLFQAERDNLVH